MLSVEAKRSLKSINTNYINELFTYLWTSLNSLNSEMSLCYGIDMWRQNVYTKRINISDRGKNDYNKNI